MIMPDVLIVENYRTMSALGLVDTIPAIGLPYIASAFGIFLLRQTFKSVPRELDEAARIEGAERAADAAQGLCAAGEARLHRLRPGLGQLSLEQFLWPLIVTNSVEHPAADGRPADFRLRRSGHRLVGHHRRDAHDLGAAAGRLSAVPAPIRAEFHARRNSLKAAAAGYHLRSSIAFISDVQACQSRSRLEEPTSLRQASSWPSTKCMRSSRSECA